MIILSVGFYDRETGEWVNFDMDKPPKGVQMLACLGKPLEIHISSMLGKAKASWKIVKRVEVTLKEAKFLQNLLQMEIV